MKDFNYKKSNGMLLLRLEIKRCLYCNIQISIKLHMLGFDLGSSLKGPTPIALLSIEVF